LLLYLNGTKTVIQTFLKKVIRTYKLNDESSQKDDLDFWEEQSIEQKIEVVESLRRDALKMGLFPDTDEHNPRLRRVFKVTKQV